MAGLAFGMIGLGLLVAGVVYAVFFRLQADQNNKYKRIPRKWYPNS